MTAYTAHSLVDGFPGKSSSHGSFGWSSLWLLTSDSRKVLVDTGPPQYIPLIHDRLAQLGLTTSSITDVLVTHLHWDHVQNFTMYSDARVWVGERELEWAVQQPAGTAFMPDLHVQEIARRGDTIGRIRGEEEVLPGIHAIASPGHTPGHLAFHVETTAGALIFAGDAAKNIYELTKGVADSTMDQDVSHRSILRLRSLLRETDGILVPGHDVGLRFDGPAIERIETQQARIGYFADGVHGEQDRRIP
ncbi:MBL fold metallo-hydrolase [Nonomuraea angiospora]|uniref:MBL fold metallo-hydrolase n=1 Tax=Nonomuraea angiospora TaxID=46172 RepID=UPI0029A04DEB|nr:MBL fold metallo-hydrolase [Nonomuraea angiospora]MDX3100910.1 MBL fold metallo-hydrolase [Nonomuraea angiospora]